MGLLDYIGRSGGYGGLLDALMYQSPLMAPQAPAAGPQYDPLGNVISGAPQTDSSPFGAIPNFGQQFAPQNTPSVFNGLVQSAPIAGLPGSVTGAAAPQPAPASPPAAPVAPPDPPQRTINVGGYAMPQIGNVSDFTPQPNAMASADRPMTDVSAQARPRTMPSFLGPSDPSASDRLMAGVQNFTNGGGLIPALVGGISGLATGQRTDKAGIAQQNLRAQYDALAPIVGPQKALLAVMNPEAGKTILAQALEKQAPEWRVIGKDGDGKEVYGFVDARHRTVEEYKSTNAEPSSSGVAGPDGKMIPYPAGLDASGRKTFANEIARANAKAAAGEKTEVQANAEQFGNRMESAEQNFGRVSREGLGVKGAAQGMAGAIPVFGGFMQSADYQKMDQAKRQWVTALLRKESGAAIGKDEYTQYDRQFFPQPGDSDAVVAQKTHERAVAVAAMKRGAGPGYQSPAAATAPNAIRRYNPETGRIE